MNKAFEKILERLEATRYIAQDDSVAELIRTRIWNKALHKVKQIVKEVAEEQKDGWIDELLEAKKNCGEDSDCSECPFGQIEDRCILTELQIANNNKGGWIPCSERQPKDDSICIVTVEYPSNETVVDYGWFDRIGVCWYVGMQEFRTSNIIAWQPLPEPYKEFE